MDLLEEWCARQRDRLLAGRPGKPYLWLEDVVAERGLTIKRAPLPGRRFGELDLARGLILINSELQQLVNGQADLEAIARMTTGHELGHEQMHRPEMLAGVELTKRHEDEAFTFGKVFLMPREMLREDPSIRRIVASWQSRTQVGRQSILYLLDEAAERFGVSRGGMADRLIGFGMMERDGDSYRLLFPSRRSSIPPPSAKPQAPDTDDKELTNV